MKKVIDGKVYNTETAQTVGTASYGYCNDFSHWEETLYRSKGGASFVAGSGGPMSHWAEKTGPNETTGSSGIRLLGNVEALEWAEEAGLAAEVIEKHFKVEET